MIKIASKQIRLSAHARLQTRARGASEREIIEAIRTAKWEKSELNKFECRKNFSFKKSWNGKYYKTKQVRPIFADEITEIVVVTVYVYYF